MGPSTWDCKNTVYGFGDNTAGPIWKFEIDPKQPPFGAYENQTNYPVGENLYNPTSYSLAGQTMLIWASSRTFGPICGYNVVNMIGFIASAAIMYGFVLAISKKRWIAWLAGYAVSFSPYFQMKVGGHPGYGYQALLIGCAWALLNLFKNKRKKDAVIFAVVTAVTFYFDPYFSLLGASIIAPLILTWLGFNAFLSRGSKLKKTNLFKEIKLIGLSLVMVVAMMLPLVYVIFKNSSQINSSVAALRGNILFEAKSCSNLPHEYALPFVLHPVFERVFGKADYINMIDSLHSGFTCGIGEDTVGISIVALTITSLGMIIFGWEQINRRKIKVNLGYDKKILIIGMIGVAVVAGLIALPPIKIMGFLPTPSYLLIEITTTWRTLTRMYVPVNFAVITLFSVILVFVADNFKKYRKTLKILFVLVFFIIFVEYQAFKPFIGNGLSTFSYKNDVPTAYTWLRDQSDINVIAEYPLEKAGGESNAMAYYLSMQNVHHKKLFNSNDPLVYEETLRASLKDLSDYHTLSVLRGSGVDHIVIHGVSEEIISKVDGLQIVHVEPQAPFNILAFTPLVKNDITIIAKITAQAAKSMMKFEKGFARNTTIIKSAADWSYEALNESVITISPVPGEYTMPEEEINNCFSISLASNGEKINDMVTINTEQGDVQTFELTNDYKEVSVSARERIIIKNEKGYNFRIKDLGCR
ncbi:MAG: hypothetical protein Q7T41_03045 [Candidatus Saccharibacteria bacterium]|nr:hypothetical protein [Candidatus Saccharibacteria bacterium]